ncbi:MAG: response regulator [Synechococcaceae cyanobacterium RM1_1_27]|nr:response regulator [Synechococcaceae cyanobacterium RM1_1_27]
MMPFVKQGWLVPAPVGDLPLPTTWSPPATGAMPKPQLPLIACIDDSPTVGKAMEFILTALGYEALVIMDPLNAITALHKSKPVLIFLDLLMPHTNGYELCASLRRTTLFRDVPIIILNCHPDFFSPQPKNPASWATQHFSIAQRCRSRGRYGGGLI